jgi:hypothetical protein
MTHAIHRVERFEIVSPYTLALQFEDGTEQRIDFRPVLEGELFEPLQNPNVFNWNAGDLERKLTDFHAYYNDVSYCTTSLFA